MCFFPGELQLGGVGRNTLNLAREFLAQGVKVDLFLSKKVGPYVEQIPEGVRIFEGGGSVRRSILPLARYLRREEPDMIIAARPYINLATVLARAVARTDTKVVLTERTSVEAQGKFHGGVRYQLIGLGCRLLYPFADHVVAVSNAVATELQRSAGLREDQVEVIYNPVVTRETPRLCAEAIEDDWWEDPGVPVLLAVGRLTFQKDFETLIRAFATVQAKRDIYLLIIGEGEERAALETLVSQLNLNGRVLMPGYVRNPLRYMARSAVFVLSSRWEGLPTVLIEAMAAGAPVVSTDCPGGSREILADGEFGRLVPVGDPEALADAILGTLDQPVDLRRLRDRAEDFSSSRAAERYLSLDISIGSAR